MTVVEPFPGEETSSRRESLHPCHDHHRVTPFALQLFVDSVTPTTGIQPVSVGIPFPKGLLQDPRRLSLSKGGGDPIPLQTVPLAHWADGSIKWLLLDFLLPGAVSGELTLRPDSELTESDSPNVLHAAEFDDEIVVETGAAVFRIDKRQLLPFRQVLVHGQHLLERDSMHVTLTDARGRQSAPRIERLAIESGGGVRLDLACSGMIRGRARLRFACRLSFYAHSGLVRVSLNIHNPRRARHRRGLWDLGDPGSVFFRDLSLRLRAARTGPVRTEWRAEPGQLPRAADQLEIYQDSSGGENWQSRNHVNRLGRVPCRFRGYRTRANGEEKYELRASPVVAVVNSVGCISAAISEFWQNFPKAIDLNDGELGLRLFPQQFGDLFELQGGEQKTHTVWLSFDGCQSAPLDVLDWVSKPACVHAPPKWYADSGAIPHLAPADVEPVSPLDKLLTEARRSSRCLLAGRETIDEYGWRNYGDVYADHERDHYVGPEPLISHYNNQYDQVYGGILQYLRTGQRYWWEFLDPLARHVIDIDIYHTTEDKAAYNGGLFWFTDHYRTAATSTHRTYARTNACQSTPYGGGPGSEHNFSRGLLHYYYLTGDPGARDAVLELAGWVTGMDDGRRSWLRLIDGSPTGLATSTASRDYHGPGRACGNSINSMLDAWLLTGSRRYLHKAEEFIRRSIHPKDDVAGRDLLNAEKRWSYTVFLAALDRYLCLKADAGELDESYAYGQASLLHYAKWMADNERPYLDHRQELQYPTEAWPGQDLRKANVLRLAAAHTSGRFRNQLLSKAAALADRSWQDLVGFPSRASARSQALVMTEGTVDHYFRKTQGRTAPRADSPAEWPVPVEFTPQKTRILDLLTSPGSCVKAIATKLDPVRLWRKWAQQ